MPRLFHRDGSETAHHLGSAKRRSGHVRLPPYKEGCPGCGHRRNHRPNLSRCLWGDPDDGNVWNEERGNSLADILYGLTGAEGDQIIEELIDELIDNDVYRPRRGEQAFYDPEYLYALTDNDLGTHGHSWRSFRRGLMFDSRFFNPDAERSRTRKIHRRHLDARRRSALKRPHRRAAQHQSRGLI